MKLYTIKRKQFISKPPIEVFDFFSKPENLSALTPPNLGFQILTPSPIKMQEGAIIDYTITIMGLPVRWTSLITTSIPPLKFVDLQMKGPYSYWHHTHIFTALLDGTLIEDEILYSLPLGIFGRVIHTLFVKRQLDHIFSHRAQVIEMIFSERQKFINRLIENKMETEFV